MAMNDHATAKYRIIADSGGSRYRFFCDVSGMVLCTTKPVRGDTQEEELKMAWETEGKQHFNRCAKCGKWVSDPMLTPICCSVSTVRHGRRNPTTAPIAAKRSPALTGSVKPAERAFVTGRWQDDSRKTGAPPSAEYGVLRLRSISYEEDPGMHTLRHPIADREPFLRRMRTPSAGQNLIRPVSGAA